jgi:hypothetical protein
MPILEKISKVEMRKEHFESIFTLLDIKNFSDEIIFQKFVDNSIQDQTDKVIEICKQALDQMTLRQEVQI